MTWEEKKKQRGIPQKKIAKKLIILSDP